MRSIEPGCFKSLSRSLWKALEEEFHWLGFMVFGLVVEKLLIIE
jgi:hypothetical protein